MLTIGDFARHGQVSVRMLRHYDATGLLRPAQGRPGQRLPVLRSRPVRPAQPHHRAEKPGIHPGTGGRDAG